MNNFDFSNLDIASFFNTWVWKEYDPSNLIIFLKNYSQEDLLTSFLVLNLWLPNISSPIKLQYLYVLYEEIFEELLDENQIKNYSDFVQFIVGIFKLLPSLTFIEDYVPEMDWWEIKYFYEWKKYKIFYGTDLSHVYEYYSALEIIHNGNEENYNNILWKSFLKEFESCLKLQDFIINSIDKNKIRLNIRPGNLSVVPRSFWESVINFLQTSDFKNVIDESIISIYKFNNISSKISFENFIDNAHNWKNCMYFFIEANKKLFPVLPRKYCTVIYEAWYNNLLELKEKIDIKNIDENVVIEFSMYMKKRIFEDKIFSFVSPIDNENKLIDILIPSVITTKKKLWIVYSLPIFVENKEIETIIKEVESLWENMLRNGCKFLLNWSQECVELSKSNIEIDIIFLYHPITTRQVIRIEIPHNFNWKILQTSEFLGIIDEINDINQLDTFFEFSESVKSPFNSYLDIFAAFIDTNGVIIEGDDMPTLLSLDVHWGSNFRYESLKNFWNKFPDIWLFWTPRSWEIKDYSDKWTVLISKENKLYLFHIQIWKLSFYMNSAIVDESTEHEMMISEQLMNIVFDEIHLCKVFLEKYFFNIKWNLQIFFCPNELIERTWDKFKYLSHLKINKDELLKVEDVKPIKNWWYWIRIIFNTKMFIDTLSLMKDKSLEVEIFEQVLNEVSVFFSLWDISPAFRTFLTESKKWKVRHWVFVENKVACYPNYEQVVIPWKTNNKTVNREISIALSHSKIPTWIISKNWKETLNQIKSIILSLIHSYLLKFNFNESIRYIISKNDALHNQYFRDSILTKKSKYHEIEYELDERAYKNYSEYILNIKNYRFIIEKIIQIKPTWKLMISEENLQYILALIDSFLHIQSLSDIIFYDIENAEILIETDYIINIKYPKEFAIKQDEYWKYIQRINLWIEWNTKHQPYTNNDGETYFNELNVTFNEDFEFTYEDLMKFIKILSNWSEVKWVKESTYYQATKKEIIDVLKNHISSDIIIKILNFLTIESELLTKIRDENWIISSNDEIPIWEHNKRIYRYTLQPIIKTKWKYIWWPYSIYKTGEIFLDIPNYHKLPANFNAPKTTELLKKKYEEIEKNLEVVITDIIKNHTWIVKNNIWLNKIDKSLKDDLWDIDILWYIDDKNVILSIESKIIWKSFCLKDSKREKEYIYGRSSSSWKFKKWYLQKHEARHFYLCNEYKSVFQKLWIDIIKDNPKIISLFVTKNSSWWTNTSEIDTEIKFLEVKVLDDFLNSL